MTDTISARLRGAKSDECCNHIMCDEAADCIDAQADTIKALMEALEGVSQRLAFNEFGECRGWSEGLLDTKHALDNSRKALIAAKETNDE